MRLHSDRLSFTVSEPFSTMEIEPIIYTFATGEQRGILRDQSAVEPFPIKTICLERIFADKIFAAEFYFERAVRKPRTPRSI